jgi:hypothetical protein
VRFVDDKSFRAKLAALAKTAEGLKLGLTETGEGHFLVSDGKRDFKVVLALTEGGNIDASCECETYRNGNLCVHIAYALKSKYDLATDSFNIPKLSAVLDRIIPELGFKTEEKKEEEKEISEEKAKEVSTSVQKLVAKESDEEEELIKRADDLDAKQIILSLEGDYSDLPLVYEFKDSKGKMHTILSWSGYTKAALLQGNIKVEFLGFEKVDDKYIAKARAIDLRNNVEVPGVAARMPKFQTEFVFEILAAKAIRNALKKILDPDILAQVVKYAKERKLSKELPLREAAQP